MTNGNARKGFRQGGLSDREVEESRRENGRNEIEPKRGSGFFKRLAGNFSDPIIRVLLIALAVNIVLTYRNINWVESGGIIVAIMIATLVSTVSEYGSEKAFERLRAQSAVGSVRVLRNGCVSEIPVGDVVVGDILELGAGEAVCADGVIIEGRVTVDQSALNGESAECEKYPLQGRREDADGKTYSLLSKDRLYSGSLLCEGNCKIRVEKVGGATMFGSLASELSQGTRESPLKLRLSQLAGSISRIGYFAAALVVLTYIFNVVCIDSGFLWPVIAAKLSDLRFMFATLVKAATIGITVIVVAVPEGLPMMITVVLSSNMKRMLRGGVLVRKLVGIETAGSMNLLFFDKTGTITRGKLHCRAICLADGKRFESAVALRKSAVGALFALQAGSNTDSVLSGGGAIGGNSTDRALLGFFADGAVRKEHTAKTGFDSSRKYSSVTLSSPANLTLYKGAPEMIIASCASYACEDASELPFGRLKNSVREAISALSRRSSRVVAFAYGINTPPRDDKALPDGLVFLGYAELADEMRAEAGNVINELHRAGIQTVMMTGDSRETAAAVASDCSLLSENGKNLIITGEELSHMSDYEVSAILPHLAVIARAVPTDKSRLVRIAQEMDLVVGMTGDGVNDAPALKKADVGFAIGSGTQIAKEAADIVILDDNLASIARSVLFGRTIFKSIRKFIVFQLTMNLCAVGVSLTGQLMGIDSPVTVIQMLWVNIIMDTLGGLAFSGEAPLASYMCEPPKKRGEKILNASIIAKVVVMGVYALSLSSAFLSSERMRYLFGFYGDPVYFMTAFFALFIFTGVSICFIARSERVNIASNLSKNKLFIVIMLGITAIQLLMLYFGGATFRCAGMSISELLLIVALSMTVYPVDFARRVLTRIFTARRRKRES